MTTNDQELLGQFARDGSQDAFTALVKRHLNLVYSAARRRVQSSHLAEEVAQSVFIQLARHAADLKPDTVLSAWLYQVTRRAAVDAIRRESRRQAREQIAFQRSSMDPNSADWTQVEPLLEEAMDSLNDADRLAILLRYFENKSFQEVGAALGASEGAAQRRVSRALERLREFFTQRKVAVGAGALAAMISTNAVEAAPAGLVGVVTGAGLAATAPCTSVAVAAAKTIAMSAIQKTIIATVAVAAVVTGVYKIQQASTMRQQAQALQQQQAQEAALSQQLLGLQREHDRASNALAAEKASPPRSSNELLKLRGEVGRLRLENSEMRSRSPLSKVTADPEARKSVREQQKQGMGTLYKEFVKHAQLSSEQADKLGDLLADHIMADMDVVTTALRDKLTSEEMESQFAVQESALQDQIQALLGPEGLAQYRTYTRTLLGSITTAQFGPMLTGSDAVKADKAKQLFQAVQEEAQAALASAGLPAEYPVFPALNFRNVASEQTADQNLKLLDGIYQQVSARSGTFLSPEELASFQQYRAATLTSSRSALALNRAMLAPTAQ